MIILFRYGKKKVGAIQIGNKTNSNFGISRSMAKHFKIAIYGDKRGLEEFVKLNNDVNEIDKTFK